MSGKKRRLGRWVKIAELGSPELKLPPQAQVELLATAITDLGLAQALVMIHGTARGLERYYAAGGRVRMSYPDREPEIWCPS